LPYVHTIEYERRKRQGRAQSVPSHHEQRVRVNEVQVRGASVDGAGVSFSSKICGLYGTGHPKTGHPKKIKAFRDSGG
jgi:hypothetical protein